MKKTLLIFSMALGSLVAFAQTPQSASQHAVRSIEQFQIPVSKMTASMHTSNYYTTNDYKGSVFTKAGANLFPSVITFNAATDFEKGTITPPHSLPSGRGQWIWMKDTTEAAFSKTGLDGNASLLPTYQWLTASSKTVLSSESKGDGYMLISPINSFEYQLKDITFDAYATLTATANTTSAEAVYLQFYQRIKRFNTDKFFVEYRGENSERWDSVEINIRGLEMLTNEEKDGVIKVILPKNAAGQSSLQIRFRYAGSDDAPNKQPAGYYWIIDDVAMYTAEDNELRNIYEQYARGFYHSIPRNLKPDPLTWQARYQNTGANTAKEVRGIIRTIDTSANNLQTDLAITNSVDSTITSNSDSLSFGIDYTQKAYIPTSKAGSYMLYSMVESAAGAKDSSIRYNLNINSGRYYGIYASDNGKYSGSRWTMTYDANTRYTNSQDTAGVNTAGYKFSLAYRTDSTSASVDGSPLYVNGVQFVSALQTRPGCKISGYITRDSLISESKVLFVPVAGNFFYNITEKDIPVAEGNTLKTLPTIILPFQFSDTTITEENDKMRITTRTEVLRGVQLQKGQIYRVWYQYEGADEINAAFYLGVEFSDKAEPSFRAGSGSCVIKSGASSVDYIASPERTPFMRMLVGVEKLDTVKTTSDTIWKGSVNQLSTETFNLSNYPNPAKDQTTISYTLVKNGNVHIEVRDVMGRIVKSIEIGNKVAGKCSYVLNTADFKNGTYFYSLKVNGISQTKKMLINR